MTLQLEVGKTYTYAEERGSGMRIVSFTQIVGEVEPGTLEYKDGFRFYDDDGIVYKADGYQGYKNITNLAGIATSDDLRDGFVQRHRIDLSQCNDVTRFVPRDFPNFTMKLGGLYINKMGVVIHISKVHHTEKGTYIYAGGGLRRGHHEDGLVQRRISEKNTPSMQDIAYQIIKL